MKVDNRIWILITVVLSGAILAGAWFLGVSPLLASAASADESLAAVTSQNTQTVGEISSLKRSKGKLNELSSQLASLRQAVPTGVDGTAFISEVDAIAATSGVVVQSITLDPPVAYTSPAPAPTDSATSGSSGTSAGATPSPTPSASESATAAAAPTGPTAPIPVTDPLITAANLVVVQVHVQVKGGASQTDAFLHGLQYGKRLVLATDITRATDKDGVTLSVGGSIYVLRDPSTVAQTTTTTGAAANG